MREHMRHEPRPNDPVGGSSWTSDAAPGELRRVRLLRRPSRPDPPSACTLPVAAVDVGTFDVPLFWVGVIAPDITLVIGGVVALETGATR